MQISLLPVDNETGKFVLGSVIDMTGRSSEQGAARGDLHRTTDERIAFLGLISDISGGFVNLNSGEVDKGITDCLRRIGEFLDLDRAMLFQRHEGVTASLGCMNGCS